MEEVSGWIKSDESASEMMGRVLRDGAVVVLPPPLNRVPLRVGNAVEIVGPCSSGKTQILIQAAVSCILPKHCGGLERPVMYFDLDSRFHIQRLQSSLNHHLLTADHHHSRDDLFVACMSRFFYIRCYNSFQFLATLKTLRYQLLHKETNSHAVAAHFIIIDSIGAFYWIDRDSTPSGKRKNMSLHTVVENVVQEIQKLLQVQPMLLLATKATILGDGSITSDFKRKFRKSSLHDTTDLKSSRGSHKHSYREYMPSTWQLFITHRVFVQVMDEVSDRSKDKNPSTFVSEWLLPSLSYLDKFRVNDAGIYMVA